MTSDKPNDYPACEGLRLSNIIHDVGGVEIVTGPPDLARAAHWYATRWGFPVFPCKPRSKEPLTSHGFKDATRDPEVIKAWWTRWPDANLAVPTGLTSTGGVGFDVVDIDGDPGHASLAQLEADGEIPPVLAVAFTPGDPRKNRTPGRHLYISAQGQKNATGIYPGVDLKAQGAYVMVAPSVGPVGGVQYAWLSKPDGKP